MRHRGICLTLVCGLLSLATTTPAAELHLEFVDGLRARNYHDYAILYLEKIESAADTPADVKAMVPFEKAITLIEGSRLLRNPDAQSEQLDQAEAFLAQFVKANPNHPRAGEAQTQRANIFLGKARVENWKAESPANEGNRGAFQERSLEYVSKAREIYQSAFDKNKAQFEKFPVFIDKQQNPEQFEQRAAAEIAFILSQLDLALTTYEKAQCYDPKSPEYKRTLTQAASEFEEINSKYRSMGAGLYARMWQGKCFEEQDEIGRALGIYNELLRHEGKSQTMQNLQNQVRRFRLICLNHESRNDSKLVVQEATEWLNANRRESRTLNGIGIRWELVRSLEQLGMKRDLSKSEREGYLRRALDSAREVNKYPGQYKDVSHFKIQSLLVALDRDGNDPQDFETAFGLGRNMIKEVKTYNDDITAAQRAQKPKAEITDLEEKRRLHIKETARILSLALQLADEQTELNQVNHARYLLSYSYYLMRESYRAAVLGEFVGRHFQKEDTSMALDAAYLALAAYQQAYNDAEEDQRDFEIRRMVDVCNLISATWPESDRANDARMTLGQLYSRLKDPVEAARWYTEVPETATQYPAAQLAAGQSYWTAYLEAAPLPAEEKPPLAELDKWQAASQKHLITGMDKTQQKVPEGGDAPDDLVAGKVSLAQINVGNGKYQEAIDLLTKDPHPVLKAITVQPGQTVPKKGIKSRQFAALTYQLLLRSYVGTQQIDQALSTMELLEKNVSPEADDSDAVTQIYVELGRELQKEIERLKGLGQAERLAEVRASFDQFLSELFKRRDKMTYGSLIWIAETYYGLGQGMGEDNQTAATEYFDKASGTYQDILTRAENGELEVDQDRIAAVRLRLVNCRRRQGNFDEALKLVRDILEKRPKALDAQMEAAYVFQDWGDSGQPESFVHYIDAINGYSFESSDDKNAQKLIWGWGNIANRLQGQVALGRGGDAYEEKLMQSRYNVSWSRFKHALAQSATPKKMQGLEAAQSEVTAFAATGYITDEWWKRFDELYQDVQREMGVPITKLERPQNIEPTATTVAAAADANTPEETAEADKPADAVPTPAPASSTGVMIFGLLIALGGAGAMVFFMMKSGRKRPRPAYAAAAPVAIPAGAASASGSRRPAQQARRKASASGAAAAGSGKPATATRKPGAAEAGTAKPGAAKPAAGKPTSGKNAAGKDASAAAGQQRATKKRPASRKPPKGSSGQSGQRPTKRRPSDS